MSKSSKTIIEHIPRFLNHCTEVGLSKKTHENYKHYLNKFILWLNKENKNTLLPHKLTTNDVQAYKLYLSHFKDQKGRPLKTVTQNYYLIALRALLSYFTAQDIESLLTPKITLPKGFRTEKTVKFLNLDQIEKLLAGPNTKLPAGLRDRAILETLVSTGIKVSQLTSLNMDEIGKKDDFSKEALFWIKEYLKTRRDNNKALFINYIAKKESIGGRLTARSIERIVSGYGKRIRLPFPVTPESLRWTRAIALLNKRINISKPQTHKNFSAYNYE